ncbi:hypothetical protein [Sandarakinorhabdus sp. AAP62]|uniref:hypothetical protein n=1 Tax=Sandarakinorhabdus sp. AAP62 TaxID=1248916 RepID=UPI0002F813F6|nr:hypothetical protein [Sandarakinorhabdus sp. AAP62]
MSDMTEVKLGSDEGKGGRTGALARDGLAVLALVLALLNVAGAQRNRALQSEVEEGQQALVRGQTFANVNNSLIQLLAKTAAERNDPALRELLARNGITFQVSAPAQPAAATPTR